MSRRGRVARQARQQRGDCRQQLPKQNQLQEIPREEQHDGGKQQQPHTGKR